MSVVGIRKDWDLTLTCLKCNDKRDRQSAITALFGRHGYDFFLVPPTHSISFSNPFSSDLNHEDDRSLS